VNSQAALPAAADVVVIGGGVIGCAAGFELASRGLSVAIIDQNAIGGAQSPLALGFVWSLSHKPGRDSLDALADHLWENLEDRLEADLEWTAGGSLRVAETAEELPQLDVRARNLGNAEVLDAKRLLEVAPFLRHGFPGALYSRAGGHTAPHLVAPAFANAARRCGASLVEGCAVRDVEVVDGRVSAVITDLGSISTRSVVCAGGVWSSRLLRPLGLRLPAVAVRGLALDTQPLPAITDCAVTIGGLGFRQRPDGTIRASYIDRSIHDVTIDSIRYARTFLPAYKVNRELTRVRVNGNLARDVWRWLPGSPERVRGFDPRRHVMPAPDPKTDRLTIDRLVDAVPGLFGARVERSWGEPIEVTPDELPVIEALKEPAGLVLATAFSGHGLALSPIVGRLVAELVVDGRSSVNLHQYRLARFEEGDWQPTRAEV
jgi:glycine/D-amino acid oxidase-like deaminating enzyme